MKYPTVSALCEGVAGAIREKEGSSALINPQDFVQRIENLQVGGGTSESSIEYLDVSRLDSEIKMLLLNLSFLSKAPQNVKMDDGTTINAGVTPSVGLGALYGKYREDSEKMKIIMSSVTACSIDLSTDVILMGQFITINDVFVMYGMSEYIDSIPRLTKEQFYTLE